jgi:hypothetical protein
LACGTQLLWPSLLVRSPLGAAPLLRDDHRRCRARNDRHCSRSRSGPTAAGCEFVLVLGRSVSEPRLLGLLLLDRPRIARRPYGWRLPFPRQESRSRSGRSEGSAARWGWATRNEEKLMKRAINRRIGTLIAGCVIALATTTVVVAQDLVAVDAKH